MLQVLNSDSLTRLGADASDDDVSVASGRRLLGDNDEDKVIGQPPARPVLSSWNKIGSMTWHVFRATYIRYRLQVEHQPIVEGMNGFGCAIEVRKFVTRHAAPASMIERYGLRTVEILQVNNRGTQ